MQRTVVINAVDEANSDLSVIVGHQDDVKQLLTVWIELSQPRVDVHQGLFSRRDQKTGSYIITFRRGVTTLTERHLNHQFNSIKQHVSEKDRKFRFDVVEHSFITDPKNDLMNTKFCLLQDTGPLQHHLCKITSAGAKSV